MPFPTCRHRMEPRTRSIYQCRSPKLIGLKQVTADVCNSCPYPDHHYPGEPSPFEGVRPDMPVERMVELLEQPARAWPPGWGDWEVTHQAHRIAADRFLAELPPYPEGRYRGRGIVMVGSGAAYFPSLYVSIRAIRHVGLTLPIQVWYLGREHEMPSLHREILEALGVELVDADEVRRNHPCRILQGWELKAFAVLHSPFEEVFFLDADCYPVRDPSPLWENAEYRETGAMFWPDLPSGVGIDWRPYGVAPAERWPICGGQFLVNKRLCWRPLQLAWWYNDHSDWSYLHGYGDQHTFEVAWVKCGGSYARGSSEVEWSVHSYKCPGPDGDLLFVHRCGDKFRFGEADPRFLTAHSRGPNVFHPGLPLEHECFGWLEELREMLQADPVQPATARKRPTVRVFAITCPESLEMWEQTLQRWRATDWGEDPIVSVDKGAGPPSPRRLAAHARRTLSMASKFPSDYYLFIEDDVVFNLHLAHNLHTWAPIRNRWLWMGSLSNMGVALMPGDPQLARRTRCVHATHDGYYGAQSLV